MRLELSHAPVIIGLRHTGEYPRKTEAWIKTLDGTVVVFAQAVCSDKDRFCRRTGRQLAARRLVERLRLRAHVLNNNRWGREDRKKIFLALCPEFDN